MLKDYLEEKMLLKQQNRFLRFFIFLLCIVIVANAFLLFHVLSRQKIILVPVGLSKQVAVSSEEVDQAYIEEITRIIMYLALSYTPQNVEWQFSKLLDFFVPEVYPQYKSTFFKLAKDVKEAGVTSSFFITGIKYNTEKKKILVSGNLYQWFQDKKITTDLQKRYLLGYDVRYGKFMLTSFEECSQNCDL